LPEELIEFMNADDFPEKLKMLHSPKSRIATQKNGFIVVSLKQRGLQEYGADPETKIQWDFALEASSNTSNRVIAVVAQVLFFGGIFTVFGLLFWWLFT
jgi:hypothetical protein